MVMHFLHDYTGVIHIHSSYSFDGRISVPDILAAARKNNIDFLMLTDHSNLRAKEVGLEGWQDGILLIVGQEISPRFNHYLAFRTETPILVSLGETNINPQTYIDQVNCNGGFGFIAHPDHSGSKMFHVKHYPWKDWKVSDYTGIGIWDFMTDWQSSLDGYLKALLCYFFPAFFLKGPPKETLERWDSLTKAKPVVGIGELDNHDFIWRFLGLKVSIFPFAKALRFLKTHVLTEKPFTGDNNSDISMIFSSLTKGRVYMAGEYYKEAKGFSYFVTEGEKMGTMGDEFFIEDTATIKVKTPVSAKIRIIKDGQLFYEEITDEAICFANQPGVYRVEVYLKIMGKFLPWIFSNPVYVKHQKYNIAPF